MTAERIEKEGLRRASFSRAIRGTAVLASHGLNYFARKYILSRKHLAPRAALCSRRP